MPDFITLLRLLASPWGVAVCAVFALVAVFVRWMLREHRGVPGYGGSLAWRGMLLKLLVITLFAAPYAFFTMQLPREAYVVTPRVSLPTQSSGILILDTSGSINRSQYEKIHSVLNEAVERKLHVGLIIFEGDGYVALPPNAPAEHALAGMLRFFDTEGRATAPIKGWNLGGGTEAIEGFLDALRMKLLMNERGDSDVPIVLISDMQDGGNKDDLAELLFEIQHERGMTVYLIDVNAEKRTRALPDVWIENVDQDFLVNDLSMLAPVIDDGQSGEVPEGHNVPIWIFPALATLFFVVDLMLLPRMPLMRKTEEEG